MSATCRVLRWYRLVHPTLGQLAAGMKIAPLAALKWRLARYGIHTRVEKDWLPLPPRTLPPLFEGVDNDC